MQRNILDSSISLIPWLCVFVTLIQWCEQLYSTAVKSGVVICTFSSVSKSFKYIRQCTWDAQKFMFSSRVKEIETYRDPWDCGLFLKKKKKTSCLAVNHMYNHGFYRTCPKFTTRRHGTTTEHHVVEMTGNKIMCYQHVKENSERTGAPCWTGLLWVNSWALCLWPSSNPPYVTILDDAS